SSAYAHLALDDAATGHHATRYWQALGELEDFPHLRHARGDILQKRFQQPSHAFFNLIDQFIDDRIEFYLHSFMLGFIGYSAIHPGVKTQNDRIRSRSQRDV